MKREILFNIGIWIGGRGKGGMGRRVQRGKRQKGRIGIQDFQLMSARNIDVFIPVNL